MTEKVPCPVCERPMKPRHTKGTDFMPRHNNPQGDRCSGTTAVVNAKPECEDCGQTTCHKAPVSEPAPTVEDRDDVQETTVNDSAAAEHQPGRPPAQAEVDYWQQQAREAAQRHFETSEGDTPYVALRKEELAEDAANAYGSMGGADLMDPLGDADMPHAHSYADGAAYAFDPTPAQAALPTADEFLDPAPAAPSGRDFPTADEFLDPAEPEVKLNVSGQPPARRDWQGRYIVVDPDLGDFRRTVKEKKPKGITRATTFNKAAQNTISLRAWSKANVVRGASLRPDILRRAHGLTWDDNKDELLKIVDELETAAGAKVAADEGTFLHGFCDQVDAGLKTWADAPAAYQQDIKRYVEALAKEGLEPVPGLIERTVFIREYGGVAGTFDRIFYHRPSGQYIVGDLKTGKTMSYAMDETECQIWTYAHGVNQWGVYDWNSDGWMREYPFGDLPTVSEKVGVIVHMPVQGKEAGEVYLRFADLECGRAYAELNHAVRSYPKSKVRPFAMPFAAPAEPEAAPAEPAVRNWHAEFKAVTSREQANALYAELKAHGANEEYLALARFFGKEALAGLATQSEDG